MPPKPTGGRPRKYQSQEEAKRADLEKRRLRRQKAQLLAGPTDFIIYEPPHPDIPTDTPTSGLRTSPDIQIPQDVDTQVEIDSPTNTRPISPSQTQQRLTSNDVEIAEQITQIRIAEQETNVERVEYEAEIAQILIGMRSANTTSEVEGAGAGETSKSPKEERLVDELAITELQGLNTTGEGERVYDEDPRSEPLCSCFPTAASADEPVLA